jgi:hypothetical protein
VPCGIRCTPRCGSWCSGCWPPSGDDPEFQRDASPIHEPDKNHMTINRELSTAGDGPTEKIYEFLEQR